MDEFKVTPIGTFQCAQNNKYDVSRQATLNQNHGEVLLHSKENFEQALIGLEPENWIWLIFVFHQNKKWKPMTLPPVTAKEQIGTKKEEKLSEKIGVFASRSPYRPNFIGMSAVQIVSIDGLVLRVKNHDLLNGTPILDIKPYVELSDCHPGQSPGWLKGATRFDIKWSAKALEKAKFLERASVNVVRFVEDQLSYHPVDDQRKRVEVFGDKNILAYRTWRISFVLLGVAIEVLDIQSGYSLQEMRDETDKWQDKSLHIEFNNFFKTMD